VEAPSRAATQVETNGRDRVRKKKHKGKSKEQKKVDDNE
jgi:hypothetical protein